MNSSTIGCIRTGVITCAGWRTSCKTDFRAFELSSPLCSFGSIPAHAKTFFTDRNAIFIDGEIIFVNWWAAAFSIQINKWLDVMVTAVFIVSHGIMG